MSPSPRSKQQAQALMQLRNLILEGWLAPGERVSELAVVERLGISRTPVRIALTILEHEGFLETLSGGGFIVREFTFKDIEDAIELRGVLEGTAARLAAERRPTDAEMSDMRDVCQAMADLMAKPDDYPFFETYSHLNEAFHQILVKLADSPLLKRSLEHVESLPFASPNAFTFLGFKSDERIAVLRLGHQQHMSILDAIMRGEGARAEALSREHARLARLNLEKTQERQSLLKRMPGSSLLNPSLSKAAGASD